ncbi:hypothetical protein VNO77_02839 [Canavalia gladiata]|uniref:Uncharacterized protein n=1 Tax=Canavalia gladiata TaxID=3824 RepID=A0AAN9MTV0_CANGL
MRCYLSKSRDELARRQDAARLEVRLNRCIDLRPIPPAWPYRGCVKLFCTMTVRRNRACCTEHASTSNVDENHLNSCHHGVVRLGGLPVMVVILGAVMLSYPRKTQILGLLNSTQVLRLCLLPQQVTHQENRSCGTWYLFIYWLQKVYDIQRSWGHYALRPDMRIHSPPSPRVKTKSHASSMHAPVRNLKGIRLISGKHYDYKDFILEVKKGGTFAKKKSHSNTGALPSVKDLNLQKVRPQSIGKEPSSNVS